MVIIELSLQDTLNSLKDESIPQTPPIAATSMTCFLSPARLLGASALSLLVRSQLDVNKHQAQTQI
jgi:hypothetical protein